MAVDGGKPRRNRARTVAARWYTPTRTLPGMDKKATECSSRRGDHGQCTTRVGVWICRCETRVRKTSYPRGKAKKKRSGNPEASPGSGECADPPDDLRLRDLGSVLLRSQSHYGSTGLGREEPVHVFGNGIPGGLDGAVSGPHREFGATLRAGRKPPEC